MLHGNIQWALSIETQRKSTSKGLSADLGDRLRQLRSKRLWQRTKILETSRRFRAMVSALEESGTW